MDFPGRSGAISAGRAATGDAPLAPGTVSACARATSRLEMVWIGAVLTGRRRYPYLPWPSRRAAIGAAASLLDPRIGDDLLSRSDPGPGLAQFVAIARHAVRARRRRG